jgi:acetamidase/formamidase
VAIHELPLEQRFLHGYFSVELEPVVEIEPGDSVRISLPNAGWDLTAAEKFEPRNPELDTGHPIAGPIAVRGTQAGQTLVVRIDEVEVGPWGVTWAPEDHLVHWDLGAGLGRALGLEVTLAPFLGVMGMPPPEAGVHPTFPPRRWGGNIDCKELSPGRRSTYRSPSTERNSPPVTRTRLKETARSRGRRSRRPPRPS